MTGDQPSPETSDDRTIARRRRHTWIAVAIILLGAVVLGAIIWWQQHRYDGYSRDVGCALTEARGADCDD